MNNEKYSEEDFVKILTEKFNNKEPINLTVTGNSMVPFLVHKRDTVILTPLADVIKKGDILFYRRKNGKCVLHRVKKISDKGIYFVGDSQTAIEGPLEKSCLLAQCTSAIRKGRLITKKNLIWHFFSIIWLNIIPVRLPIIRFITKLKKLSS